MEQTQELCLLKKMLKEVEKTPDLSSLLYLPADSAHFRTNCPIKEFHMDEECKGLKVMAFNKSTWPKVIAREMKKVDYMIIGKGMTSELPEAKRWILQLVNGKTQTCNDDESVLVAMAEILFKTGEDLSDYSHCQELQSYMVSLLQKDNKNVS